MKRRIAALALAALLLGGTGCSAMLERSYVSATAHVNYDAMEEDPSVLQAENYQSLVNSILYFVQAHAPTGTIRLYNYTGDVETDLANACAEVLNEDPLGAYAVRDVRYDTTRIVTYYEVSLSIIYSRSAQEVAEIRQATGLTSLRSALSEAVGSLQDHAAIRLSNLSWTRQELEELFWQAYYSNPIYAVPGTQVELTLYPDDGAQRILEYTISWPQTMTALVDRAGQLTRAASQLLQSAALPEEPGPVDLARVLRGAVSYAPEGSADPLDAFSGITANEMGLLLSMELLCRQADLDCVLVIGSLHQEPYCWLIVENGESYRHLLPQDLTGQGGQGVALYTDEELAQLGYSWQAGLYPVCLA